MSNYRHTSERLAEEANLSTPSDYFLFLLHVATYEFARQFVEGKVVLDFGCGTGYGTRRLADSAAEITGIDISSEAIKFARSHYLPGPQGSHLLYRQVPPVEARRLPFEDASFDTVLSFQVIEHVSSVDRYLAEIRRVLRPGGCFVCATPDRRWRLFRNQRPFNRFHHEEWDPKGVRSLLSPYFEENEFYGMTARADILELELRRVRRLKMAALPFTFPGAPERWRLAGIDFLKGLPRSGARKSGDASAHYGFDLQDIVVVPDASPSVNVVSVSRRALT